MHHATTVLSKLIFISAAILLGGYAQADGQHGGHSGAAAGAASPIGQAGQAAQVTRTIEVDMSDAMRFSPDHLQVQAGETVRLQVKNSGQIRHELVLGTDAQLQDHYQMMLQSPGMHHAEPNAVSLAGGESGQIIWQFQQAGTVSFGCLEPGHFPAGMKGSVTVK